MNTPALELRGVHKRYGVVHANRNVDLGVERQTVHALVGENGAGKSTLMKIAYGHVRADSGTVHIKGERIARHSVAQSIARKVGMVHQHFMLVGPLTVVENVVLGLEPRRRGLLDLSRATAEIVDLTGRFHLDVEPSARIEDLSVGQQQRVEILKMLWRGCDVLILDEPTAVLTPGEVRGLFETLRGLVADGMTVVLITHKLDEVLAIADRVTVMRRGEVVSEMDGKGLKADDIAHAMVGRPVLLEVDKGPAEVGSPVLEIEDLRITGARGINAVNGVDLLVRAGEIVGIAGVEGNGQKELVEAVVGLHPIDSGRIRIAGRDIAGLTVEARYRAGLAHIPEDRHDRALILDYSIKDNLILGLQRHFTGALDLLRTSAIAERADALIEKFDIRPANPDHLAVGMSGGNQQKIVVARELSRQAPKLLLCAQPTRGVDIGAIEAIHRRMIEARDQGLAVLLVSAELSELKSLSDRLCVMYKGRIVAKFDADDLAREGSLDEVGALMTGAVTAAEVSLGRAGDARSHDLAGDGADRSHSLPDPSGPAQDSADESAVSDGTVKDTVNDRMYPSEDEDEDENEEELS
ncbi:MAG: ABC transporter ATP-binding protein [Proteobacteria bacterium]|nr:ABC transporter ATP-binding protein [Pseudomonadota bacterium]